MVSPGKVYDEPTTLFVPNIVGLTNSFWHTSGQKIFETRSSQAVFRDYPQRQSFYHQHNTYNTTTSFSYRACPGKKLLRAKSGPGRFCLSAIFWNLSPAPKTYIFCRSRHPLPDFIASSQYFLFFTRRYHARVLLTRGTVPAQAITNCHFPRALTKRNAKPVTSSFTKRFAHGK